MTSASRIRSSVPVRLFVAAGLVVIVTGTARAQAPGMVHTGPGINLGGIGASSSETNRRAPAIRVVQGAVLDKSGAPVKGAMVYLKNDKTSQVRSMLADEKGKFRFMSLSFNDDYKLWAQSNDRKSSERPISSLDTRSELNRDLKLE